MKIEDQICSLELAKKLKELGVKQESLWYWVVSRYAYKRPKVFRNSYAKLITPDNKEKLYSAFTVAELGEMLPELTELPYINKSKFLADKGKWYLVMKPHEGVNNTICEHTEGNARAKMLIYLLENKLMEVPK